jgi:alpha-L-fucosidase
VWFDWWIEQPAFELDLQRFAAFRVAQSKHAVVINYKNNAFVKNSIRSPGISSESLPVLLG